MGEARKQESATDQVEPKWVSLNETTKMLDMNRETVLQLGIQGVLKVERMGRWTFVSRQSIERYLAANSATAGK